MKSSSCAWVLLAIGWTASLTPAADTVWPTGSAGEISTFVALQRFGMQADHCSARIPRLKPQFDSVMASLDRRMQGISKLLFASEAFAEMKDKPVPANIVFSFKDLLEDARHNFERLDAETVCPKTLQNLGEMDDDSLKAGLVQIVTSVQNMIRNLEKAATPQTLLMNPPAGAEAGYDGA